MNKKGFTLIEILAVIVIIGIVGAIGVASISTTTDKSRKSSFATLAKTYAESARTMRGEDRLPHDPKSGEIVFLRVDGLDGTDKNDDYETEFGALELDLCSVAVVNNNHSYKYYVTIVDDTKHSIVSKEYSTLSEKSVDNNYNPSEVFNFRLAVEGSTFIFDEKEYKITSVHEKYVVGKIE